MQLEMLVSWVCGKVSPSYMKLLSNIFQFSSFSHFSVLHEALRSTLALARSFSETFPTSNVCPLLDKNLHWKSIFSTYVGTLSVLPLAQWVMNLTLVNLYHENTYAK